MNSYKNNKALLNKKIKEEKELKDTLYQNKLEKKDLRKKGKKTKEELDRFKELKIQRAEKVTELQNCTKEKNEVYNVLRNENRKMCKENSPNRNKYTRRYNNNNIELDDENEKERKELIKKEIKKRKIICKECKKKRPLTRLIKNNKYNKYVFKYNKSNYRSINGFIKDFENIFNGIVKEVNDECLTYNSQLDLTDIFYVLSHKLSNNKSISSTNQHLKNKDIVHVSNNAINKKRKEIDNLYFKKIYDKLIKEIIPVIESNSNSLNINNKLFAVDGSIMNYVKDLHKEGFKLSEYGTYCSLILSCIYDVSNEIPVDIHIDGSKNEAKLLTDKINVIPENSILMGDAKYFSKNILNKLQENNIYGIFKVSRNINMCKTFLDSEENESVYNYYDHRVRLIKIKCGNEIYIIGTTILDEINFSKQIIIDLFKQRWFIEEYFKTIKCTLNLNKTKSKLKSNIYQEIYVQMIVVAISKYIEIMAPKFIKNNIQKNLKINKTILIKNISDLFLFYIFYRRLTKKYLNKIEKLLFDIINNLILIEDNRFEKRQRKLPLSEYQNNGNHNNG